MRKCLNRKSEDCRPEVAMPIAEFTESVVHSEGRRCDSCGKAETIGMVPCLPIDSRLSNAHLLVVCVLRKVEAKRKHQSYASSLNHLTAITDSHQFHCRLSRVFRIRRGSLKPSLIPPGSKYCSISRG